MLETIALIIGFLTIPAIILGIIAVVISEIWALIDISRRKKKDTGWRLIWAFIVLALSVLGVLIYYFSEVREKK